MKAVLHNRFAGVTAPRLAAALLIGVTVVFYHLFR